jgi:hypothetical protein
MFILLLVKNHFSIILKENSTVLFNVNLAAYDAHSWTMNRLLLKFQLNIEYI